MRRLPNLGLFGKIVLWFFLTIALITIIFAGMTFQLQSKSERERMGLLRETFYEQGKLIVSVLNSSDPREKEIIEHFLTPPVWIFNDKGELLFSSKIARTLAENDPRIRNFDFQGPVTKVLNSSGSSQTLPVQFGDFAGFLIADDQGKNYAAIIRPKKRFFFHFQKFLLEDSLGLWILGIFSTIGLLCFGLAQYLLKPIFEFQRLSRNVSMGELQARLPVSLTGRSDELGALAVDFNTMAGKIEKTIKDQQQLLWDISHELRTPLTRIGLALELSHQAEPEKKAKLMSQIESNLNRLNALIQQILDYARLNQWQNIATEKKPVDLIRLGKDLVSDFQMEAESQKKIIHGAFPDSEVVVMGSPELLRRVLENLLRNAIQHTPPQTTITLNIIRKTSDNREWASICVQDSGGGVQVEDLPRIFEPFFQCVRDRTSSSTGIGLGLAIVKRTLDAYGGMVFASNAEPHGLLVEARFPLT